MRIIHLRLSKTVVFERVSLITAYHGVRNDDAPCYDRVAMMEADRPWLDSTLSHALQRLCSLLAPFHCHDASDDSPTGAFLLRLRVPPSVSPSLVDRWTLFAYEYLESAVLTEWFAICAPHMATTWQKKRDDCWLQFATSVKLHNRHARTRLLPM